MNEIFNQAIVIITNSIVNIDDQYLNFQVAGNEETIERERVYCAELYHQIRNRIDEIPYSINSEPNKIKHPYIEGLCGAIDPDLIIHQPGSMNNESNLAVIEIKRSSGDLTDGILKDMQTINCMTTIPNGYYGGIVIIYGELSQVKRNNLINRIQESRNDATSRLVLILHAEAKSNPEIVEI